MSHALDDLNVVDVSGGLAGTWCARMFGSFGAHAIVVEPAGGSPIRRLAPFDADGSSIVARYAMANTRSATLDRSSASDVDALRTLIASSDVLVEGLGDGALEAWGIDVESLLQVQPGLIVTSITPNGLTGPLAGRDGNDLTASAHSGWANANQLIGRPPIKGGGLNGSFVCGGAAFGMTLAAIARRERDGLGQRIDFAEAEAMLLLGQTHLLRAKYNGALAPKKREYDLLGAFPVPTKNGFISFALGEGERFRDALIGLGVADQLGDDPRFSTRIARDQHREEFVDAISNVLATWDNDELFHSLARMRIPVGPALHVGEVRANEQLRARGYFVYPDSEPVGLEFPGAPYKMSGTPWRLRTDAPHHREDTDEVLAETARRATVEDRAPRDHADLPAPRIPLPGPLSGTRAVVLTQVWVGTFCTQLLALLGCDVIQIEARKRIDIWRGGYEGAMPKGLAEVETAVHPWNCNGGYNAVNLNKRGITLDLGTPEGKRLFLELVKDADFVVENFTPRVMNNLGLGYDQLTDVNPDLIMASIGGYGQTGPWRDTSSLGGTIEPSSGMSSLMGFPDGPPMNSGVMVADAISGYYAFTSLMVALHHRDRSGEGQFIDVSMQEACTTVIGDAVLQHALTGEVRPRIGNRHLTYAPHGIYATLDGDRWVALAAEGDAQWHALCEVVGHVDWLADPRFATNADRKAHEDDLDAAISEWMAGQERDLIAERLATAGVLAAPVLDAFEVGEDVAYRQRGVVVDLDHPEAGRFPLVGIPPHLFSRTPGAVVRPSPLLGQHSFQVLTEECGVSPETFADLEARGITGEGPPPGYPMPSGVKLVGSNPA